MKYGVLNENHLFVKAYNKGKKVVLRHVVLFVLEDKKARFLQKRHPKKEKLNRVGITATKKLGSAVKRNRAKRIIREAWRQLCQEKELVRGKLVVIAAREACNTAKTPDVLGDLLRGAAKLELIRKEERGGKEC